MTTGWVVFERHNGRRISGLHLTKGGARSVCTKANKKAGWTPMTKCWTGLIELTWGKHKADLEEELYDYAPYAVTTVYGWELQYNDPVVVKSLMTGNDVVIRRQERGNRALDPSMEGYWTL